ncbi:MAG: hypothetical protein P1U56_19500 [Saprospiraceae bacterium]|nr:hypothetical protein [Saprospiraceae bacterium]
MYKASSYWLKLTAQKDLAICILLIVVLIFPSVHTLGSQFEYDVEKIENFADGEKEKESKENMEDIEIDELLLVNRPSAKYASLYLEQPRNTNNRFSKLYRLKIPTPPPDTL